MAKSGFVYCPYDRRDVPIEQCQGCPPARKENCSTLPGW